MQLSIDHTPGDGIAMRRKRERSRCPPSRRDVLLTDVI